MAQQVRTEIKCSDCGKTATVPFKPTAGKAVYCRECLAKHRSPRAPSGPGPSHSGQGAEKDQAWSRRRPGWK